MSFIAKKILLLIIAILLISSSFYGCMRIENPPASDTIDYIDHIDELPEPDDGKIKIHVVTEPESGDHNFNDVLSKVAKAYEKDNPGVKIQIEVLSDASLERENQMKLIRNGVLSGEGPDVFLLPGGQTNSRLLPLFFDVELAMRNGMFYDISDFYEDDEILEKEYLNDIIMEAGVLDGSRYVLPLYYDIPVVMIDSPIADAYGIDTEKLKDNVMDMMDTLLETEDPMWCAGAYMGIANNFFCHDVFPDLIDYSSEEVMLTKDEIAAYMRKIQMLHSYVGQLSPEAAYSVYDNSMKAYVNMGSNWNTAGLPIHVTTLNLAFEYAAISKSNNGQLEIFPLRATDGSVNANVTYWGAVGAGSKHPDLAYDFLRIFLQEDVQWERIRMDSNKVANTEPWRLHSKDYNIPWGLVTTGWPVRSGDSVEYIWRSYYKSLHSYDIMSWGNEYYIQKLMDIAMEDTDFQILDVQIDEVRFSNKYEKDLSKDLASLNDGANGFAPNMVDIEGMAMDAVLNLESLLYEGH